MEPATTDTPAPVAEQKDVLCPLCGYNLRGLPEARCPECGGKFEWDDLTNPTKKLHPYLFEHHPRSDVWSFVRTAIGALRPREFWHTLHPAQPSRPKRLILYWLVVLLIGLLVPMTQYVLRGIDVRTDMLVQRNSATGFYLGPGAGLASSSNMMRRVASEEDIASVIAQSGSVQAYVDLVSPSPTWKVLLKRTPPPFAESIGSAGLARGNLFVAFSMFLNGAMLVWPWLAMLSLMLLRTTMRQASVRPSHLLRVGVYCGDMILWLAMIQIILFGFQFWDSRRAATGVGAPPILLQYAQVAMPYASFILLVIVTWRFAVAIRAYLRFRHAPGVAIAVQIIFVLLILQVMALIYG